MERQNESEFSLPVQKRLQHLERSKVVDLRVDYPFALIISFIFKGSQRAVGAPVSIILAGSYLYIRC